MSFIVLVPFLFEVSRSNVKVTRPHKAQTYMAYKLTQ